VNEFQEIASIFDIQRCNKSQHQLTALVLRTHNLAEATTILQQREL
jgi:hypothetical protein